MRKVRLESDAIGRMKIHQAEVNDCSTFDPDRHDVAIGRDGQWHIVPKPKRTVDERMSNRSDRVIRTLVDLQDAWDRRNEGDRNER